MTRATVPTQAGPSTLPRQSAARGAQPMPAQALLSVLWDGIEAGLTMYDGSGRRLMANAAAIRLLGLTPDSPDRPLAEGQDQGRIAGRIVYVADGTTVCPKALWPLPRALAGEIVRNEEFLIRDADHPEGRRMIFSAYPVPLEDGTTGALVAFHDVTQDRHEKQANSASLDELSMLIDGAAGYAILQLGPAGEVRSWSQNAQRLLGYTAEEIVGRPYATFFSAGDAAGGVPESILTRARTTGTAQGEGARVRKDGTQFWADGVTTAVRNNDGDVVAFVKVLHDVTPRYLAERAVESLNRELEELNEGFSYSVSHDLRGPIRAIHGFSRLLRERHQDLLPADGQALLSQIEQNAVRMGELIDALLRLSRMQRQPMQRRSVGMTSLVRQCWPAVTDEYPDQATRLKLGPLDDADADPQLMRQVWMNLLGNAVKFSQRSPQPLVEVTSRLDGDQIVFEVRDNGAGFDPRYEDKLFKVFQQLHPGQDYAGVGMGLAIVHRIVHRHGGRVWASGNTGEGATFGFSLPQRSAVTAGRRSTDVR